MKIKIAILLMVYSLGAYASENKAASEDRQSTQDKNIQVLAHGTTVYTATESPPQVVPLLGNKDIKVPENNLNQPNEPSPSARTLPVQRNTYSPDSGNVPTQTSLPVTLAPTVPAATANKVLEQHVSAFNPTETKAERSDFLDRFSNPLVLLQIGIFVLTLGLVLLILKSLNKKNANRLLNQNQPYSRNTLSMSNNPLATNTVQMTGYKKPADQEIKAARKKGSASTAIATALNPSNNTHTTLISASATIDAAKASNVASVIMTGAVEQKSSSTAALIMDQSLPSEFDAIAVLTPVEPELPAIPQPPYSTTNLSHSWKLFGISKQGQAHLAKAPGIPCQDSHNIQPISDDWGVVVVCDGAGSQSHSQHGAKFVAKEIAEHLAAGIPQTNIYKTQQLPSPEAWHQYCKALVLQTRKKLEEWIVGEAQSDQAIEGATIRDVGCTLIWTVYTPMGLLTGHVGDGRAGYRDAEGWHAMMTPWEGEYSNQTVFINTDSIYADQLENQADSTRPFLESRVIDNPNIDAFVLMSDGCESGLYETVAYDAEKNANVKINRPHAGVCNNIIEMLEKKIAETSSDVPEAERLFTSIVEEGNTALKNEGDDKTLVLGFLTKPVLNDAE